MVPGYQTPSKGLQNNMLDQSCKEAHQVIVLVAGLCPPSGSQCLGLIGCGITGWHKNKAVEEQKLSDCQLLIGFFFI